MSTSRRAVLVAGLATTLAACSSENDEPGSPSGTKGSSSGGGSPSGGAGGDGAQAGGLPTPKQLEDARAAVGELSNERLAAQLVMTTYVGNDPDAMALPIRKHHLGGVILFPPNVPTGDLVGGLRAQADRAHQAMKDDGRDWPAMISVDQEGGPVARITSKITELPGGMAYGASPSSVAERVSAAIGEELAALGFTMVFSPDGDVTLGPKDPTIGVRSPGSDPKRVAETVAAQVRGYRRGGVIPVIKHFPGHGSVTTDSHVGLPIQGASVAQLKARDLVPFAKAVEEGAPALMTAHIVVKALDSHPSTLSKPVLTTLLRQQMGFRGLVVTDSLVMDAVAKRYGANEAAVRAVAAGADVVLMPKDPVAAARAVAAAVTKGDLTRDRLVQSAAHIVATLRAGARPRHAASVVGSHDAEARELARSAVTVLSGGCSGRLVDGGVTLTGGTAEDRAAFEAAARRGGLSTGSGPVLRLIGGETYRAGTGQDSGPGSGDGKILVALDVPYGLTKGDPDAVRIAAFGRTPETFDAVVAVLLGKQKAGGRLPVDVGRWKIGTGC